MLFPVSSKYSQDMPKLIIWTNVDQDLRHLEPLLLTWVNINPSQDKYNHIHYKVWDEIDYPFPKFNGATLDV